MFKYYEWILEFDWTKGDIELRRALPSSKYEWKTCTFMSFLDMNIE